MTAVAISPSCSPANLLDGNELIVRACSEIIQELAKSTKPITGDLINQIRNKVTARYKLPHQPKLVDLIACVPEHLKSDLVPFLRAKPVRTASGVAVVAVMCKPHRCPHIALTGNICVYCPGGPDSDFEYSTQSYTGYEPTSMRAIRARYNPYEQARQRLEQLEALGHATDKVEYIIMGGTFMSLTEAYRAAFVRSLHDALSGSHSASLAEAVGMSERCPNKCVGITIETRPDYCLPVHLRQMLAYGCTRLEIGVQSVYEDVARDTNRGHTVQAVTECFEMAKEAGFKIVAHMMPDLPNCGWERDVAQFAEFFENPLFRSDGLKIYPTLVIRGTGLYELWRLKKYTNYPPDILIDLLARVLAMVPPWTRVYRIQRDIPMPLVTSGVQHGNLREHVLARMHELGLKCRDVRTREVGIQDIHHNIHPEAVELVRRDYFANGGWETFLAYEDPAQDILVGLLRLRRLKPCALAPYLTSNEAGAKKSTEATGKNDTSNITADARWSMVRELHVYGSVVPVHARDPRKFQHQGFGALLMEEAEQIALQEHRSQWIAVIAGVGTRNYYRKLGYDLCGPYMVKQLFKKQQ